MFSQLLAGGVIVKPKAKFSGPQEDHGLPVLNFATELPEFRHLSPTVNKWSATT